MKITVIGGGNMGGAIARGALTAGIVAPSNLTISDPSGAVQQSFAQISSEIKLGTDSAQAIEGSDMVIVAVKPWLMESVLTVLNGKLDPKRQILVSIAAGVTFETMRDLLPDGCPAMFRIIPNTAISLAQSNTFVAHQNASPEQVEMVLGLFAPLGKTFVVTEQQMTACTALGSCGTAFALKYIDASITGGIELGLDPAMVREVVLQTVKGALMMLETGWLSPQTEIDRVTTPGGITLKGLEEMERSGFSAAVINGLKASK